MPSKKKKQLRGHPKGSQLQVMGYYPAPMVTDLNRLSKETRIPKAALLREALEDLLKKYANTLRKAPK